MPVLSSLYLGIERTYHKLSRLFRLPSDSGDRAMYETDQLIKIIEYIESISLTDFPSQSQSQNLFEEVSHESSSDNSELDRLPQTPIIRNTL